MRPRRYGGNHAIYGGQREADIAVRVHKIDAASLPNACGGSCGATLGHRGCVSHGHTTVHGYPAPTTPVARATGPHGRPRGVPDTRKSQRRPNRGERCGLPCTRAAANLPRVPTCSLLRARAALTLHFTRLCTISQHGIGTSVTLHCPHVLAATDVPCLLPARTWTQTRSSTQHERAQASRRVVNF